MRKFHVLVMALGLMILPVLASAADKDVLRIAKEELKAKMEKGEDILILDMRSKGSYDGSMIKIKGAIRIAPNEVETKYKELHQDKEIITYCT